MGERVKAPTDSAEGSFPAWAAAALSGRGAVSVLAVPGTSGHQQLRRLHLALALFGGVRPAAGEVGESNIKPDRRDHRRAYLHDGSLIHPDFHHLTPHLKQGNK